MAEQWLAPTPRDEVLARVVARGRRIRMVNRLLIGLAVAGTAGAGVVLGVTDTLDVLGDVRVDAALDAAPLHACPGGEPVAELHRGDRVLLTGRDEDGAWVQLRSPIDPADRVWMRADHVTPDADVSELPVEPCGLAEFALTLPDGSEVVVTTTDTTLPEEETTTTTTKPGAPPTTTPTQPGQPQPPGPKPSTTTTQPLPKPSFGKFTRSPSTIKEDWNGFPGTCLDTTSVISVDIQNATEATMSWDVGPNPRSKAMVRNGQAFSAQLGPFYETTTDSQVTVTITVTAKGPGGTSQAQTTVTLLDCPFG